MTIGVAGTSPAMTAPRNVSIRPGTALVRPGGALLLHPPAEVQRIGVAAVDVAGVVHRDGFEREDLDRFPDESRHDAVLDAADADARLVGRIHFVGGSVG